MQLELLDWIIIVAFFVVSLSIGIYFSKRASGSINDFFLGGRNMPWLLAGVSMVATTFAADTPLAVTELVRKGGISGNWLWWNMLAGGMLTTFFFARLWRRAEVLTEVELIELRYTGKAAAFLRGFKAVYLGLFMNVLIMGWVNVALASILQVFFGIDHTTVFYALSAAMLVAAVYSSLAGLWGVAVTDFVQFIMAMTGSIVLAVVVLHSPKIGGMAGLKAQLPPSALNFFPDFSNATSAGSQLMISAGAFLAYIGMQWWASWYPGAEPGGGGYIAQRMMSTKTEKGSVYSTLLFQVSHYCLRPWPWIIVALGCFVLYPHLTPEDARMGYVYAMRDYLPVGLRGLLLTSFFAAYLSTISTQLNWGAGYLVNDVYKRFIDKTASEKKLVFSSRIITLLLMAIALSFTSYMNSISGTWQFILECGAGLGLVLILRWYWWRINAWSEIAASITPFILYGLGKYAFGLEFPNSYFLTVGGTTVIWLIVTFATAPTEKAHLAKFYNKVKPGGNWRPFSTSSSANRYSMKWLTIAWICSIIFTYSLLFATGKFLFLEWNPAIYYAVVSFIALGVLVIAMRKTSIL